MAEFVFKADARFKADDIDDALARLAHHFLSVALGEDSNVVTAGTLTIERVDGTPEFVDDRGDDGLSLARLRR